MIRASPIKVVGLNEELTLRSAKLKLKYGRKLSLADCCLVAVAESVKGRIVTVDRALAEVDEAEVVLLGGL